MKGLITVKLQKFYGRFIYCKDAEILSTILQKN